VRGFGRRSTRIAQRPSSASAATQTWPSKATTSRGCQGAGSGTSFHGSASPDRRCHSRSPLTIQWVRSGAMANDRGHAGVGSGRSDHTEEDPTRRQILAAAAQEQLCVGTGVQRDPMRLRGVHRSLERIPAVARLGIPCVDLRLPELVRNDQDGDVAVREHREAQRSACNVEMEGSDGS
jgi:hypothetical protein